MKGLTPDPVQPQWQNPCDARADSPETCCDLSPAWAFPDLVWGKEKVAQELKTNPSTCMDLSAQQLLVTTWKRAMGE